VRIHRDEPKPVLKGQRGDPEVGIGENPPRPLGLAAQPRVDAGGGGTGREYLESIQKLFRPRQRFRRHPREHLTIKKLAHYRNREDGRVALQGQSLYSTVPAAQKLEGAGINEQGHG